MITTLTDTMDMFGDLALKASAEYGFYYPYHADEYSAAKVNNNL